MMSTIKGTDSVPPQYERTDNDVAERRVKPRRYAKRTIPYTEAHVMAMTRAADP
jgi:hypothetical protein